MIVRKNVKIVKSIELTAKSCITDKSKDVEVFFVLSSQLLISFFVEVDLRLSFLALSLLRCWTFLNRGLFRLIGLSFFSHGLIFQFFFDIIMILFSVGVAILVAVDADKSI